jgi:hypothetical protein
MANSAWLFRSYALHTHNHPFLCRELSTRFNAECAIAVISPTIERETVSPPMAARILGVGILKIHQWIESGELVAVNLAAADSTRPRWQNLAQRAGGLPPPAQQCRNA